MEFIPMLKDAVEKQASDIFIVSGIPVSYKLNGTIKPQNEEIILPEISEQLLTEAYRIADRDISRLRTNGDDDFSISIKGLSRFRINAYKQRGSLAAVIRLVAFDVPDPKEMSIPEGVMCVAEKTKGLVLVTGPAGGGKSTTLACIIDKINRTRNNHIITLEEPIEYLHKNNKSIISQREIHADTEGYVTALRASLRQSPDVILVGEMRDFETINAAVTAAETGHLVLSTLHTTGAAETLDRIVDVYPAHSQGQIRSQLSNVLVGIVSQTLVPTIDKKGRLAALELLKGTDAVSALIREGKIFQIPNSIATGKSEGMFTLDQHLAQLVRSGKISEETARTRCHDRKEFETYLSSR